MITFNFLESLDFWPNGIEYYNIEKFLMGFDNDL